MYESNDFANPEHFIVIFHRGMILVKKWKRLRLKAMLMSLDFNLSLLMLLDTHRLHISA